MGIVFGVLEEVPDDLGIFALQDFLQDDLIQREHCCSLIFTMPMPFYVDCSIIADAGK